MAQSSYRILDISLKLDRSLIDSLSFSLAVVDEHTIIFVHVESQRLLEEALSHGFFDVSIIFSIVVGPAGVGKTLLKFLLMDRKRQGGRNSTSCAEAPVQIQVRTVSAEQFLKLGSKWREVSAEKMLPLIAKYIRSMSVKKGEDVPEELKAYLQQLEATVAETTSHSEAGTSPADLSSSSSVESSMPSTASEASAVFRENVDANSSNEEAVLNEMIDSVLEKLQKLIAGEELTDEEAEELFSAEWIYLTDSGGQPQFHELLPLFVRDVSSILVVSRLCDRLDEYPLDEMYEDDKLVGRSESVHLTAEDQIKCLIRSLLSRSSADKLPKVIAVGTHRDKADECSESIDQKNEKLLELLGTEFDKQLVYYQPIKKLLFPLNTLNPDKDDEEVVKKIRSAVESSYAKKVKVPVWWYILELLIRGLAKKLGRRVLSRSLCASIARALRFTEESFDAALQYFDELNVIKYTSALPEIVFVDSQVPLSKVSELVQHSYKMKHGCCSTPLEGDWKRFCKQGIITLDFLRHFPKHYVEGLFDAPQLLELLKEQLAAVPLAKLDSSPESLAAVEEYFMPALLDILPREELEKHRVFTSAAAPLLFHFPHGCRRAGLFCCLVVHLMKHSNWSIQRKGGSLLLVARNCITFQYPAHACFITLVDAFHYIEVHVVATADVCHTVCPVIREEILSGITSACEKLKYLNDTPQLAVFCPHHSSTEASPSLNTELRHAALVEVKDNCFMCTKETIVDKLKDEHKIWLSDRQKSKFLFMFCILCTVCHFKSSIQAHLTQALEAAVFQLLFLQLHNLVRYTSNIH